MSYNVSNDFAVVAIYERRSQFLRRQMHRRFNGRISQFLILWIAILFKLDHNIKQQTMRMDLWNLKNKIKNLETDTCISYRQTHPWKRLSINAGGLNFIITYKLWLKSPIYPAHNHVQLLYLYFFQDANIREALSDGGNHEWLHCNCAMCSAWRGLQNSTPFPSSLCNPL